MFDSITLHGTRASLVWGYRPVAALTAWRIVKTEGRWRLAATFARADAWQCGQAAKYQELLFEAPRDHGRWCWALLDVTLGTTELRATLGPPLQ